MDIMPLSADKGNAIREIEKEDYLDTDKLIVFGDAPNDLTMFESARVAVAMGSADIKIKSHANYIADSNDDEGLFKFVNKLKNNDFKI